jgi:hypothetical protein
VLFERIVELVAGRRLWREESERLRRLAERAELKVTRTGDFLRTALNVLEAGDEQYHPPEAPSAPGHRGDG